MLIPIGVASKEWLTLMTVADCRREIERRSSALIGMQVYDTDALSAISALRLRVRFRPWWQLHQASELVVYLRSETARSKTAVRVEAGLRVGVVISLLVWTGFLLIPIFVFQTLETRIFSEWSWSFPGYPWLSMPAPRFVPQCVACTRLFLMRHATAGLLTGAGVGSDRPPRSLNVSA